MNLFGLQTTLRKQLHKPFALTPLGRSGYANGAAASGLSNRFKWEDLLVPIKQQQVNIARIYSDWHQRNDKPIATQMQLKVAIWIALVYVAN